MFVVYILENLEIYFQDSHGERTIRTMYCLAIVKSGDVNIIGRKYPVTYGIAYIKTWMNLHSNMLCPRNFLLTDCCEYYVAKGSPLACFTNLNLLFACLYFDGVCYYLQNEMWKVGPKYFSIMSNGILFFGRKFYDVLYKSDAISFV